MTVDRFEPEIYDEDRVRMELDSTGDYVRFIDYEELMEELRIARSSEFEAWRYLPELDDERKMLARAVNALTEERNTIKDWCDKVDSGTIGAHVGIEVIKSLLEIQVTDHPPGYNTVETNKEPTIGNK